MRFLLLYPFSFLHMKEEKNSLHTHWEDHIAFMNMHIFIYQTVATGHYFFSDSSVKFKVLLNFKAVRLNGCKLHILNRLCRIEDAANLLTYDGRGRKLLL